MADGQHDHPHLFWVEGVAGPALADDEFAVALGQWPACALLVREHGKSI